MFDDQKSGTAYIERYPLKYPKRASARAGLRPRSHLSAENRRLFDALAKQEYYDILNDVDGNDRPNLMGILSGTDIMTCDAFFKKAYDMMMTVKDDNDFGVAAGVAAAGGAAYGVSGDPNILFVDSDEE